MDSQKTDQHDNKEVVNDAYEMEDFNVSPQLGTGGDIRNVMKA